MNHRFACLALAVVLLLGSGLNTMATTVSEVQKQQTETKNRLNEINKSIDKIEQKQSEVRSQLSHLNEDLVETMLTLELLEADIETKQEEINEAQEEYERLKALEEEQYQAMKLRIQYMYERGSADYIALLLESESISDLLNKADFVQEVSDYDDEKLDEYQETKRLTEETKERLEEEKEELLEVQEDQKVYKDNLDKKIASAKSKVKNFETELANAKSKAQEYRQTIEQQNQKIRQLEEEERRAAEEAAKQKENASSNESSKEGSGSSGNSGNSGGSSGSSGGGSSANVSGSGLGARIASYALQFVGNPYVYGGTSLTNGADCSGFTWAVHKHFGISIPRRSTDQAYGGKSVSLSALQAGDIIYYGNHVAIYIGNNQVVHASTERDGIKISHYRYRTPKCAARYW